VAMELGRSAMAVAHSGDGQGLGKGRRKTRRWRWRWWCVLWDEKELGAAGTHRRPELCSAMADVAALCASERQRAMWRAEASSGAREERLWSARPLHISSDRQRRMARWRACGKAWRPRSESTCRPLSHFLEYVSRVAVPDLKTIFGPAWVRTGSWA
jgi:hypothetical protein